MNQQIANDLYTIYGNYLDSNLMVKLIDYLDVTLAENAESVLIKTRNQKNQILKYRGTPYFSLIYLLKEKPVIFAGNVERVKDHPSISVIRFLSTNKALQNIPINYIHPYINPKWVNVEISNQTIDIFPQLIRNEISNYFSLLVKPPQRKEKNSSSEPKEPTIPLLICIAGFILIILIFNMENLTAMVITFVVAVILMFGGIIALVTGNYKQTDPVVLDELRSKGWIPAPKDWVANNLKQSNSVCCPRCGSEQISANKRGFKVGRAIGVGVATGAFGGLLAGSAGKDKIIITCLKCGHEWKPGK